MQIIITDTFGAVLTVIVALLFVLTLLVSLYLNAILKRENYRLENANTKLAEEVKKKSQQQVQLRDLNKYMNGNFYYDKSPINPSEYKILYKIIKEDNQNGK